MGRFVRGDVVVARFPFSDLSASKKRPALVLASFPTDRVILCQITSQAPSDAVAISRKAADFQSGSLRVDSRIRPNYLFTAESTVIAYRVGMLTRERRTEVVHALIAILNETKA